MKTWIALLRGINVGGNHKLPMKDLVKAMEKAGYENVQTYIQSGNVVFQSATRPKDEIGKLIHKAFGFHPEVFVFSMDDFKKIAKKNPFKPDEGKAVHFFFCDPAPKNVDYALLDSLKAPSEEYKLIGAVFYLHAPDGIGRSKLVEKMGKAFKGINMTARNLNTINKLLEMGG